MAKSKTHFVCQECGASHPKWSGRCGACQAWNSLVESVIIPETTGANRYAGWIGAAGKAVKLTAVEGARYERQSSGIAELDRVLGGGLVPGSVTLIGGDPGIGKSTLLMQTLAHASQTQKTLYVTGEESVEQVALRAQRLGLHGADINLLAEIELEKVLAAVSQEQPALVVLDSIQTIYSGELQSAPGTVAQVRECAAQLTRLAKNQKVSVIIVGHVTKEGTLAGPRVLEHMVDTVLYFEGEQGSDFRMIRAFKNRFGAVNELGVFRMGETGLEAVDNPSSMFLTTHDKPVPGVCVLGALEGNRPFLVEVQCLVEDAQAPNAKRSASGIDTNRLQMLLAVLNKHAGVVAFDSNVYAKVVGGVRLTEPAADLAVLLAAHSSLVNRPLPPGLVVFGEVGLAGEVRSVQNAEHRLLEARKLGFTSAVVPARCQLKKDIPGMTLLKVSRVDELLSKMRDLRKAA